MSEPDRDLNKWLDAYRVADVDSALLDRITAAAAATPQMSPEPLRLQTRRWAAQAAAFAIVALLGFWVGTGATSVQTTSIQQSYSSTDSYLDKIIFGPTSWKEVTL